jgi:signal peptidase I
MSFFAQRKPDNELAGDMLAAESSAGFLAEIWDWMKSVVIALIVVVMVHQYGFHLSTVKGASMQPTLEEDEWLFINKTVHYIGGLKRGDVVVVKEPDGNDTEHPFLVKRVVAVEGDEVQIRQGQLFINGNQAQESYTDTIIEDGRLAPFTVPSGSLFVMGDNRHRHASYDSRSFGAVTVDTVEGRAELIVWPFRKFRVL